MRVLGATAALVLVAALAGPTGQASAQSSGGKDSPHLNLLADQPSKTPEEKEAEEAKEKAYKESLKKIPDAKQPNDPWGTVRSDAPQKAPAKAASTATKTKKAGSNAN